MVGFYLTAVLYSGKPCPDHYISFPFPLHICTDIAKSILNEYFPLFGVLGIGVVICPVMPILLPFSHHPYRGQ